MSNEKFVFIGNRFFVLEEMLARGLDVVRILAVRDSYLERTLVARGLPFDVVDTTGQLVEVLTDTGFDYFIANGCPFILPISRLENGHKVFLNIHPGPLPDLRGADPVPGALLHHRDSGATCHVMDDGIDTGPLVARVVVPNTDDLDAGLLYQVSFLAEKEVFRLAHDRGFAPDPDLSRRDDTIYYTRQPQDLWIDLDATTAEVIDRVRAFSNKSQGARFQHAGQTLRVFAASRVDNPFLLDRIRDFRHGEVVFRYEDCLLLRHHDGFLHLKGIDGDLSGIEVGSLLQPPRPAAVREGRS